MTTFEAQLEDNVEADTVGAIADIVLGRPEEDGFDGELIGRSREK